MIRSDLIQESYIPQPRRLRFTVDEYYKMIEMGMIDDYERCEILDGEMIPKMTIGDRHAFVVSRLARILIKTLSDNLLVRIQDPLRLDEYDEPEPDIVIADLTKFDGKRHPRPKETIVVIEVSDSTLKVDREIKLPKYAEVGIQEAWIVNLPKNVVEVHQSPEIGVYQTVKIFKSGEAIESVALPDLKIEVDNLLS